jgi:translation initiation factor 5B
VCSTPVCVPSRRNLKIGRVTKIESNHVERTKATEGDEVAIQIEAGGLSVMYGRQFDHNDRIASLISRRSINALKSFFASELKPEDVKVSCLIVCFSVFII